MKRKIKFLGYSITTDPSVLDLQHGRTPELENQLERMHHIALKGKRQGLKILHRMIEKHPRSPQLKNYLSVWYNSIGNLKKAQEVNHWIIKEHPNYFFAKVNLALIHYFNEEFEKMPEVLGDSFDLQMLYPKRDVFHFAEVLNMLKAAVFYYSSIGDLDQAEMRLDIMKEIDPDSVEKEQAHKVYMSEIMKAASIRYNKESGDRIEITLSDQKKTTKTIAPAFNHSEINLLYQNGFNIKEEEIELVLKLPRATLIQDLESVLRDSIERWSFFHEKDEDGWDGDNTFFVLHSIYFLAEIKATESLNSVLNVLSQSETYLSFYLGDFLTEDIWEPICKLAENKLDVLEQFMKRPGVFTFSKTIVSEGVKQLALHHPALKDDVIQWYENALNFYLKSDIKDNVVDSMLNGSLISRIPELEGDKLLPIIKKLFEKNYVDIGYCGDFEEVEKMFTNKDERWDREPKNEILSLADRYKHSSISYGGATASEELPLNDDTDEEEYIDYEEVDSTPVPPKKVGRNDPCPCGSGKKHKRCCLLK